MTIADLLRDNLQILRRFHRNGIATDSIRFLPLYDDWERMCREGLKKQYIENVLSEKYGYKPRYIRLIVKFMGENVI